MGRAGVAEYRAMVEAKLGEFLRESWKDEMSDEFFSCRLALTLERYGLFTRFSAGRRHQRLQPQFLERSKEHIADHYGETASEAMDRPPHEGRLLLDDLAIFSRVVTSDKPRKQPNPYGVRFFVGVSLLSFLRGGTIPGRKKLMVTMGGLGLEISDSSLAEYLDDFRMADVVRDRNPE